MTNPLISLIAEQEQFFEKKHGGHASIDFRSTIIALLEGEMENLRDQKKEKVKDEDKLWAAHYLGFNEALDQQISQLQEVVDKLKQ